MEKKIYFLSKKLLWAFVIVQIAMLSSATNLTTTESLQETPVEVKHDVKVDGEEYAWSSWGSWSACSRSCGGGVSVQERQCLPRIKNIPPLDNSSIPPPVITVRVTRETHAPKCQGVDKRYHECNDIPCPGGAKSSRAAQCAAFDRRPFRGRFYTWVPYIDGNAPCTLNCRPMGQHFYASLSLVADGTPCTQQGYRAICVQGTCKFLTTLEDVFYLLIDRGHLYFGRNYCYSSSFVFSEICNGAAINMSIVLCFMFCDHSLLWS